ncbi:MAG: ABC transporter permease [Bacilli bacterium]
MSTIKLFLNEHISSFKQLISLSISSTRKHYAGTSLGIFWSLYKDIIYLVTYSFFMTFIYRGGSIDGAPRTVYLVTGMLAWFFISEVLSTGSQCLIRNRSIFKSIKFPVSIIPTYETLSIFYRRSLTYVIGFIILAFFGYLKNIQPLLFIYYNFAMIMLMIAFTHFISGFIAISKDFKELYMAIIRIIIYFIPIFWSVESIGGLTDLAIVKKLILANPITYILCGFRESFQVSNYITINYHLYFWGVVFLLLILGAVLQGRLRKFYPDFL